MDASRALVDALEKHTRPREIIAAPKKYLHSEDHEGMTSF